MSVTVQTTYLFNGSCWQLSSSEQSLHRTERYVTIGITVQLIEQRQIQRRRIRCRQLAHVVDIPINSFKPSPPRLIAPGRRVYPSCIPAGITTSSLSLLVFGTGGE